VPGIVTGAVAGWFANKIFGPSAEALGKTLATHLQTRLPTIFGRAEQKAAQLGIEPKQITPGLLSRMIMDASFSDDDETITEWWAGLFVSASQHGDNKHAVFSDMMAVIGPQEAACLKSFMDRLEALTAKYPQGIRVTMAEYSTVIRERLLTLIVGETPISRARRTGVERLLANPDLPGPALTYAWCLPFMDEFDQVVWEHSLQPWFERERLSIEILERTRIFRFVRVDVPVMGAASWIDLVEVTALGVEFYLACNTGALN
jgi:hypothetical protein